MTGGDSPEIAVRRARLAEIERDLGRLQHRHDIAMSAFLFEEATSLGQEIAALDKARQALAAALPPPPAAHETGVVPVLARPRRSRPR
ncbi:MAG: hypothetical protein ACM3JG_06865 [Thiohalocapsa sp.]